MKKELYFSLLLCLSFIREGKREREEKKNKYYGLNFLGVILDLKAIAYRCFAFLLSYVMFRHLNTVDDPLTRAKWMNVKKAISEETEVVKQLDAEKRSFKEAPVGRRPNSPPISAKSSFVFQPLDEYPTSSGAPMDDPDVWRPPSRDTSRRPTRAGQVGTRKSPQDGTWARGSTRAGTTGRGAKAGASSKSNTGVRASTAGKKGTGTGKAGKADSVVKC